MEGIELTKGGEKWGSIFVKRRSNGVEVWARLDPKVEELIQSATEGNGSYTQALESYGRNWIGMNPTPDIKVYSLDRSLDSSTYTLNSVCGAFKDTKGRVNLSFLAFVGIGKPDGVRFMIGGPSQAEVVKEYAKNVMAGATYFLREYLVPIDIGLNIMISNKF